MGLVEHDLEPVILQRVVDKYKSLGLVPKGYYYPEFYQY